MLLELLELLELLLHGDGELEYNCRVCGMAFRNVSKAWLISFMRLRSRALAVFRRYLLNGAGFCFGLGVLLTCFFCSTSMRFWIDRGRRLYFSGIWMCSSMSLHLKFELTLVLRPKDGPLATVAIPMAYGSLHPIFWGQPLSYEDYHQSSCPMGETPVFWQMILGLDGDYHQIF